MCVSDESIISKKRRRIVTHLNEIVTLFHDLGHQNGFGLDTLQVLHVLIHQKMDLIHGISCSLYVSTLCKNPLHEHYLSHVIER